MSKPTKIWSFLKENKWKFLGVVMSTVLFAFILFPFDDLSDLVSAQVSKMTNNQIYLQFDKLHMSLFPQTGVAFSNVHVEGQGLPALKAQELVFTPSVWSLITQKPAGSISASQFLNGQVEVSLKPGSKSDNGVARQKIMISAQKLSLAELRSLLDLPLSIKGQLNLDSQIQADLSFSEQPDVDFQLKVEKFELPSGNLQTQMGPLSLPELKLAQVDLKGRLAAGKMIIEQGVIGQEKDEVHGSIKGDMMINISNRNGTPSPDFGGYNFELNLNIKKSFQDRAALFLSFIDNYKTPTPEGAKYSFKLNAANLQSPPSMSALR